MADDTLEIYQELHRRNAVPPEHQDTVNELVRRGLIKGDATASDDHAGWDPNAREAYAKGKAAKAKALESTFDGGWSDEVGNAATFGLRKRLFPLVEAVAGTPYAAVTGGKSFMDRWNENWGRTVGESDAVKENLSGLGALSAGLMGGMMAAPAMGVVAETEAAAAAASRIGFWGTVGHGAKTGAVYGGVNAAIDTDNPLNTAEGVAGNIKAIPGGMADGAIAGGVLSGLAHGAGKALDWRRGRQQARAERNAQRAADMADGPQFGAAIPESPTAQKTTQGLAASPFGSPIREQAAKAIAFREKQAQELLRRETGGIPSNDMGAEIQATLKSNVTKPSIPNRVVDNMPAADLERVAGPVTNNGFLPPRPVVEPVQPRAVDPIAPVPVPDNLPPPHYDRLEPNPMTITEQHVKVPSALVVEKHKARILGEDLQRRYEDARSTMMSHQQKLDDFHAAYPELKQIHDQHASGPASPREFATIDQYSDHQAQQRAVYNQKLADYGYTPEHGQTYKDQRSQLERNASQAKDMHDSLSMKLSEHASQIDRHGEFVRSEVERLQAAENKRAIEYATNVNDRRAKMATENQRSQMEADAKAAAEAQTRDATARADAEAKLKTQAAEAKAQRDYDQRIQSGEVGFKTGQSRESYPTEFAAAYKTVENTAPSRFPSNPLMGLDQVKSGKQIKSETARVINDLGIEANNALKIKGYKDGEPFTKPHLDTNRTIDGQPHGAIRPDLMEHLHNTLGSDVANRLEVLSQRRVDGKFVPKEAIRDLRTAIRRAATAAEKPLAPGEVRTVSGAALRRLEGAITADLHAGLQSVGAKGKVASEMLRNVDQQYAAHIEEMRKPLAKLFGEKVEPLQAMDRLGKAAEEGNLRLIRSYMRVMTEKDNPVKGAAQLVSHMTNGARSLAEFADGMKKLPADVRKALATTPEGKAYMADLERIERVSGYLTPYQKGIDGGGAIDLSKKMNLVMLASAWSHFWATLPVMAGAGITARFIASPRYIRWLSKVPPPASKAGFSPEQISQQLGRLGAMTAKDTGIGHDVMNAALSMMITPAHAEFAGPKSKSADQGSRAEADRMLAGGADPAEVWKKTNWMKGHDGKWRTEIDDSGATLSTDIDKIMKRPQDSLFLKDVLHHPELYKAYPEIASTDVYITDTMPKNYSGGYVPSLNIFKISSLAEHRVDLRETLIHEIQHWIQKHEKTEYGSLKLSENGTRDDYFRQPGEDEAWQSAGRKNMTAVERSSSYPYNELQRARAASDAGAPYFQQRDMMRPAKKLK